MTDYFKLLFQTVYDLMSTTIPGFSISFIDLGLSCICTLVVIKIIKSFVGNW